MTLKEAIESGKPFRRLENAALKSGGWIYPEQQTHFSKYEIVATDWEVKREPREWLIPIDRKTGAPVANGSFVPSGYYDTVRVREVLP